MEPTNQQIAEWIEAGLATEGAREHYRTYLSRPSDGICLVCALGLAVVGKCGSIDAAWAARMEQPQNLSPDHMLARILGISEGRADDIELPHIGGTSAAEIAQMLRNGEIPE